MVIFGGRDNYLEYYNDLWSYNPGIIVYPFAPLEFVFVSAFVNLVAQLRLSHRCMLITPETQQWSLIDAGGLHVQVGS
jgi:hypothetical protein